jgi:26S proteasome regulatory subunit T1
VLKTYGAAPYAAALKKLESQIKEKQTSVNEKIGRLPHTEATCIIHLTDYATGVKVIVINPHPQL